MVECPYSVRVEIASSYPARRGASKLNAIDLWCAEQCGDSVAFQIDLNIEEAENRGLFTICTVSFSDSGIATLFKLTFG